MVPAGGVHELNHVLAFSLCAHRIFTYAAGLFGFRVTGLPCLLHGNPCVYSSPRYCDLHVVYHAIWANPLALGV